MNKKVWNWISAVSVLLLAGSVVFMVLEVVGLQMLPARYVYMLAGLSVLLVLLPSLLLLPRWKNAVRAVAAVMAAILSCGCLVGGFAALKVRKTMNQVTGGPEYSAMIEAYVPIDSPLQQLSDGENRVFGYTNAFDPENMTRALEEISGSMQITSREYGSLAELAQALYDGRADVILLNSAYLGLLEEMPGFGDFSEKTRVLYTYGIRDPEQKPQQPEQPENPGYQEPFLMYLSGSDTRSKILDQARSDVNILAAVNPQTHQILLVNTPRDFYVPHPLSKHGTRDKLAHCGIFGLDCSLTAMTQLYGLKPDYYAQINFTGFETMVDAVGGVTVYSEKAFTSRIGGYYFPEGEQLLDGQHALAFARERYAFADGDNARGRNQMKVIQAVIEKASSASTIISNYAQILDSMQDTFVTSMPMEKIAELVRMQLSDMPSWQVLTYAVTGTGDMQPTYSAPDMELSVTWPNEKQVAYAGELLSRVLDGQVLTQADMEK